MSGQSLPLSGKTALVTGSSRGIGKAIAAELARLGSDIVVTARTVTRRDDLPGTIQETVRLVEDLGRRSVAIKADLTVDLDIDALADQAIEAFGGIDILVNNAAAIDEQMFTSFWDTTAESLKHQVQLNLIAPWLLIKALAPEMRKRDGGIIVNITTGDPAAVPINQPGEGNLPGKGATGAAYPASKAALDRMTRDVANELKADKIALFAVGPGFTLTENCEQLGPIGGFDTVYAHSMDVPAKAVGYLCSCPDPMWYTGKVIFAPDFVREHNLL